MIALKGGRIFTIAKGVVEDGVVLMEGGKIRSVGKEVDIPEAAEVVDCSGKVVMPGMIDAHSHIGVSVEGVGEAGNDTNDSYDPVTPFVRALDGVNPRDRGFQDARKAGITTVCVTPGSSNVVCGETVVIKTVGDIVDEMVVTRDSGVKIAFGENPKRNFGGQNKMPRTRMGVAGVLRDTLVKADNYRKKKPEDRERDLGLEIMARVLAGELPLRAHAHQSNDIATALRIAKEFGCRVSIEHCTEGHEIVDLIAKSGAMVTIGPNATARRKVELMDRSFETPGILARAGVTVCLTVDHPVMPIHMLPVCAALAVKNGMSEEDALKALTLNPAKLLGIERRLGSLQRGRDADVIVLSGHPFDVMSKVERLYIGGTLIEE